jgi:short-subunit dehydrogenase
MARPLRSCTPHSSGRTDGLTGGNMGFQIEAHGARAVVTGASSGIGGLYARRLAELGWNLTLVARRTERLEDLAQAIRSDHGRDVRTVTADLGRQDDTERVCGHVAEDDVALLVNNAGINGYGHFEEVDPALAHQVLAVNVVAPTLLSRAALPGMLARGRGAVVNVASLLAFAGAVAPDPLPYRVTYAGTKGYLVTFTRTLASELAGAPVQVQVLCPGLTETEFHLTTGAEPVPGRQERVHEDGGMNAGDVVTASLRGLTDGEVLCVPGLADPQAAERLVQAEAELRQGSRPVLAQRYRDPVD